MGDLDRYSVGLHTNQLSKSVYHIISAVGVLEVTLVYIAEQRGIHVLRSGRGRLYLQLLSTSLFVVSFVWEELNTSFPFYDPIALKSQLPSISVIESR